MKPRFLFITGTGTGVGKTVLTSLLLRRLIERGKRVTAVKPLCSGGRGDARRLHSAQNGAYVLDEINPWYFRESLSPAVAARRAGQIVTLAAVIAYLRRISDGRESLLVEGAGGLLSPLGGRSERGSFNSLDLIRALRATPVIVAPNRLGTLNEVLLTWTALPASFRCRSVVVLVTPRRRRVVHQTNLEYLRSHLGDRLVNLAYLHDWPHCLECPLRPRLRAALDQLLAAIQRTSPDATATRRASDRL